MRQNFVFLPYDKIIYLFLKKSYFQKNNKRKRRFRKPETAFLKTIFQLQSSLRLFLSFEDLTATIHTAFKVDMMWTTKFARVLVLDVSRGLECVCRAAHAALRRRRFAFRYCHGFSSTDRSINVRHGPEEPVTSDKIPESHVPIHALAAFDQRSLIFFPAIEHKSHKDQRVKHVRQQYVKCAACCVSVWQDCEALGWEALQRARPTAAHSAAMRGV